MARAQADDLAVVMDLLDQRTAWLHERGSDQWSTREFKPLMQDAIAQGFTWLLRDEAGTAVATLTTNTVADPDFWNSNEIAQPAYYLSKLATAIQWKGHGIGKLLISWSAKYAREHGVNLIRWDVWRTNHGLQDYYRSLGAQHLRTVEVPGRRSGALFEQWTSNEGIKEISTENQLVPVVRLPSERLELPQVRETIEDVRGNPTDVEPGTRRVTSWPVAGLDTLPNSTSAAAPSLRPPIPHPLCITPSKPVVLFNPGTSWRLHRGYGSPLVEAWPEQLRLATLRPGHAYLVRLSGDHEHIEVVADKGLGDQR